MGIKSFNNEVTNKESKLYYKLEGGDLNNKTRLLKGNTVSFKKSKYPSSTKQNKQYCKL